MKKGARVPAADRKPCEFSLIRYVPDPVKSEFVNIGVLLRELDEPHRTELRFTRDWARVQCMDPQADVAMLESLEREVRERLPLSADLLPRLQDSFSTMVQVTQPKGCLVETFMRQLEHLMTIYVEAYKMPRDRQRSARPSIFSEMRRQFEHEGVWNLMQTRIAASRYTRRGDSLRIDCGYRTNGTVKMFQAVSLMDDAEAAKGLAFSAAFLRDGVQRIDGATLQLAAFIEPIRDAGDDQDLLEQYAFGRDVMQLNGINVLTVSDIGRIATAARSELRI